MPSCLAGKMGGGSKEFLQQLSRCCQISPKKNSRNVSLEDHDDWCILSGWLNGRLSKDPKDFGTGLHASPMPACRAYTGLAHGKPVSHCYDLAMAAIFICQPIKCTLGQPLLP